MIYICVWLTFLTKSIIKLSCFSLFGKMTQICTYFKKETDVAQNLINDFFFLILIVREPSHRRESENVVAGLISEKQIDV